MGGRAKRARPSQHPVGKTVSAGVWGRAPESVLRAFQFTSHSAFRPVSLGGDVLRHSVVYLPSKEV